MATGDGNKDNVEWDVLLDCAEDPPASQYVVLNNSINRSTVNSVVLCWLIKILSISITDT